MNNIRGKIKSGSKKRNLKFIYIISTLKPLFKVFHFKN